LYRFDCLIPLSESLTMAAMMACTSLSPASFTSKVLENKHLKFLGVISYSLYVWQQSVLFIPLPRVGASCLPLVGVLSYGLIERPCIAYGRRIVAWLRPTNGMDSPVAVPIGEAKL
jgi:peptidoglycan/LPS O-acetylase OafA/YrhL